MKWAWEPIVGAGWAFGIVAIKGDYWILLGRYVLAFTFNNTTIDGFEMEWVD